MKNLESLQMESITGGDFWSGFCSGVAAVGLLGIATGPGEIIIGAATVGCIIHDLAR